MKKIILLTIAILIAACQSTNTVSEEDSQIFEKNVEGLSIFDTLFKDLDKQGELYNKILTSALDKKRGVAEDNQKEHLSVVFPGDAYLGPDYMPLIQDRLALYQKISRATSGNELLEIKEETLDRFGRFTKKEENLFLIGFLKHVYLNLNLLDG